MDRALFIAMSGAKQTMTAQAINAHNLANVNTNGFAADLSYFMAEPVYGPGYASRVYNNTEPNKVDFQRGAMQATGQPLDIAITGQGWIAVQGVDGNEAYTRAGDLRIDSNGLLSNGAGLLVLGNSGPIAVPPAESVSIGGDGTVSIRPVGQDATALAVLDRIKLVNPGDDKLNKGLDGLFHMADGGLAPADGVVRLNAGMLESSNVNAVGAMVKMMDLARHFEMQVKMMSTVEENATALSQILRMS